MECKQERSKSRTPEPWWRRGDVLAVRSGKRRKTVCSLSNPISFCSQGGLGNWPPSSLIWWVKCHKCVLFFKFFFILDKCEVVSKISPVQLLKSPNSQTLSTGNKPWTSRCFSSRYLSVWYLHWSFSCQIVTLWNALLCWVIICTKELRRGTEGNMGTGGHVAP